MTSTGVAGGAAVGETRRSSRRESRARAGGERDPLGILARQNTTRVPWLVPLREERMSQSPFTFYRGTAAVMAADQARDPHSGILVASCGDAHISNFGFYASRQRTQVFDLNDFDESAWAPWEWDLQRLVTSVIIGGRATDRDAGVIREAAQAAVDAYADGMLYAVTKSPLDRYFAHLDPAAARAHLGPGSRKALDAAMGEAKKHSGARAARRLTEWGEDGTRRFTQAPPVTTRIEDDLRAQLVDGFEQYGRSVDVDVRVLMGQYAIGDVVRRVVGVGSVGTRCYLALLSDTAGDAIVLQIKEAGLSVLEEYGGIPQPPEVDEGTAEHGQGARVIGLQRILQAYSDPFLGRMRAEGIDYYVRQFHDMKGGFDVERLSDAGFAHYAVACAATLARAHAQSPTAAEVAGCIGEGARVRRGILSWCEEYAERSLEDFQAFVAQQSTSAPGEAG